MNSLSLKYLHSVPFRNIITLASSVSISNSISVLISMERTMPTVNTPVQIKQSATHSTFFTTPRQHLRIHRTWFMDDYGNLVPVNFLALAIYFSQTSIDEAEEIIRTAEAAAIARHSHLADQAVDRLGFN